jgi:RNA polymerase sigma-70 factor (ECF subfamily)
MNGEQTVVNNCIAFADSKTPEDELVRRLQAGDRPAFLDVFHQFRQGVYSLALRLLADREEALDCSQEVFLAILRGIGSFKQRSSLKTWIYRITVNKAYNRFRGRRRKVWGKMIPFGNYRADEESNVENRRETGNMLDPEKCLLNKEFGQKVELALDLIPFKLRAAVVMRDIEELSYEEIAETLGVRLGTVKSRIARGREELRKTLKNLYEAR